MESLDSDMLRDNPSFISGEIRGHLVETAKWGNFLGIVGYVGIGLLALGGVAFMVGGSSRAFGGGLGMNVGVFGLVYIALAGLYFFPVYYLHQFAMKMKQGLQSEDARNITLGFQNLKSFFKFMGIFFIVVISIYAVVIVGAIVTSILSR